MKKILSSCAGVFQNIKYVIKKPISRLITHIIAPPSCIVCEKEGSYVCKNEQKYILLPRDTCPLCDNFSMDGTYCHEHQNTSHLQGVYIQFLYTRIIKKLLHVAKYTGSYHIFTRFASTIKDHLPLTKILSQTIHSKPTYITYIPMHRYKQHYQRGYNQAQKFAEYLAYELQLPCIQLVEKTTYTLPQMKKLRKKRLQQKTTHYTSITTPSLDIPENACILIVDDVLTTGSTLKTVAEILYKTYPNATLWGVCIARNK